MNPEDLQGMVMGGNSGTDVAATAMVTEALKQWTGWSGGGKSIFLSLIASGAVIAYNALDRALKSGSNIEITAAGGMMDAVRLFFLANGGWKAVMTIINKVKAAL